MAGSSIWSFSSTTLKNGFLASCLCSKILMSKPVIATATTAANTVASASRRLPAGVGLLEVMRRLLVRRWMGFARDVNHCEPRCRMPNAEMATDTRNLSRAVRPNDGGCNFRVTGTAAIFSHPPIAGLDLNHLREAACGERERVEKPIRRLGGVLANQVMGRMAVVAGSRGTMAGFEPGAVLILHHMAIGTGSRVVREVGIALRVNKRVEPEAQGCAQEYSEREHAKVESHFSKGTSSASR